MFLAPASPAAVAAPVVTLAPVAPASPASTSAPAAPADRFLQLLQACGGVPPQGSLGLHHRLHLGQHLKERWRRSSKDICK